jgi:hypothetical protein
MLFLPMRRLEDYIMGWENGCEWLILKDVEIIMTHIEVCLEYLPGEAKGNKQNRSLDIQYV